ncbi:MAG: hemerythrin [Myxococcales bacterium]|nr:hemerythrin [Myxococcales bacterium]
MSKDHTALENLMSEHRLIEHVLDALDAYAGALQRGEDVDRRDLGEFVAFLHDFADVTHHAKEEDILFVAMHALGFPKEGGPVACMLREHEAGRAHVKELAECAKVDTWTEETVERITNASQEFSVLLRSHIYKEDDMIYVMALERLSSEQMDGVNKLCRERDEESVRCGRAAEQVKVASKLISSYGCARKAAVTLEKQAQPSHS